MRLFLKWFLSTFLILISFLSSGNEAKIDSLYSILYKTNNYDKKDSILGLLVLELKYHDIEAAIELAKQKLELAKKANNELKIAESYSFLGEAYAESSQRALAFKNCFKALRKHQHLNNDRGEIRALNIIGTIYRNFGEYDSSIFYYEKGLSIANEYDIKYSFPLLDHMAITYYRLDQYEKAIELNKQSIEIKKQLNQLDGVAVNYQNMGLIYTRQGKNNEALSNYLQALSINKKLNKGLNIAYNHFNIASIYQEIGKSSLALESYQRAQDYFEAKKRIKELGSLYNNVGNVYYDLMQYPEAEEYYKKSFRIKDSLGLEKKLGNALNNLGSVYEAQKMYKKAIEYFSRAVGIEQKFGHKMGESRALFNLANAHMKLGEYDTAEPYGIKSLAIALEIESLDRIVKAYFILSEINELKKSFQEALSYNKLYVQYKDSLLNKESMLIAEELSNKYLVQIEEIGLKEKEKEVQLLKETQIAQRWKIYSLVVSIILLLLGASLIYRLQKNKAKSKISELNSEKQSIQEKNRLISDEAQLTLKQNQNLKDRLEDSNKRLASHTLYLVEKNKFLENLKSEIKSNKPNENLIKLIDSEINSKGDWQKFQHFFDQVHVDFFDRLTTEFKDLSPADIRLCSLLRLNKTSKEIAEILGISPQSVNIARYRLRKKLRLSSNQNLGIFVLNY